MRVLFKADTNERIINLLGQNIYGDQTILTFYITLNVFGTFFCYLFNIFFDMKGSSFLSSVEFLSRLASKQIKKVVSKICLFFKNGDLIFLVN